MYLLMALQNQLEIIPASVWVQYPMVLIFLISFGVGAKYHLREQERWRAMLQREREEHRKEREYIGHQFNDLYLSLIKEQSGTFEEALERIVTEAYRS